MERRDPKEPYPYDINIFCLRLTLVSRWHAVLHLLSLVAIGLATGLHLQEKHAAGAAVDVALLMLILLMTMATALDDARRLEAQLVTLRQKQRSVQAVRTKLDRWLDKYDRVTKLWQYQTRNKLDLFENVSRLLFGLRWQEAASAEKVREAMMGVNPKLEKASSGFGSLRLYLDVTTIDDDMLKHADKQVKGNIETIGKCAEKGEVDKITGMLAHLCGFMILRIKRARNLPNKDGGVFFDGDDLTDAYVLIRLLNASRGDCPTTRVIKDNLSPTWDEEFLVPIEAEQHKLTLELFDSDEDQWVGAAREGIGYVTVDFRDHAAKWVEKNDHLLSFQSRKNMKSRLEYSFFYMSNIKQLALIDDSMGVQKSMFTSASLAKPAMLESIGAFLNT